MLVHERKSCVRSNQAEREIPRDAEGEIRRHAIVDARVVESRDEVRRDGTEEQESDAKRTAAGDVAAPGREGSVRPEPELKGGFGKGSLGDRLWRGLRLFGSRSRGR